MLKQLMNLTLLSTGCLLGPGCGTTADAPVAVGAGSFCAVYERVIRDAQDAGEIKKLVVDIRRRVTTNEINAACQCPVPAGMTLHPEVKKLCDAAKPQKAKG